MSSEGPPAGDQTVLKFIHVTDPHLVRRGERVHGLDPGARLERCIGEINDRHEDAEFCVITGDLVHDGDTPVMRLISGMPVHPPGRVPAARPRPAICQISDTFGE